MNIKKLYFALTALLFTGINYANAQTPVELHITHSLGGITEYNTNHVATTEAGSQIRFGRMEYYISNISITHDGGTVTDIPDHYILANADQHVQEPLGDYSIINIESISFYIGVDTPENHEDPSLLPANHPLAPKSPSMHWGWTDGYRFVAMEGSTGQNMDIGVQLHSLGDDYYYKTTVTTGAVMKGGKLIIPITADYTAAFNGIDISQGLIDHGATPNNIKFLENFRDRVFKPGHPVSVKNVNNVATNVSVYPNPVAGGAATLQLGSTEQAAITVTDIQGRVVTSIQHNAGSSEHAIHIAQAGLYFITTHFANGAVANNKLVVQ